MVAKVTLNYFITHTLFPGLPDLADRSFGYQMSTGNAGHVSQATGNVACCPLLDDGTPDRLHADMQGF